MAFLCIILIFRKHAQAKTSYIAMEQEVLFDNFKVSAQS